MIRFNCPDFVEGNTFYSAFIQLKSEAPELFYDDVKINAIYGCPTNCIWNGGSALMGKPISLEGLYFISQEYLSMDIPLQLTFTNILLTKEDCYDRYSNAVAKAFHNENNSVLVASPILEEYIREKYPKYKIIKSIIASEKDCDYEEELKKYSSVVLPRRVVKDFDFLSNFNKDLRSKVELLCNDPCPIDCPRLYDHYKDSARSQLYEIPVNNYCLMSTATIKDRCLRNIKHMDAQITMPEILNDYSKLGYDNFKIAGRGSLIPIVRTTCQYFIKPEYLYSVSYSLLFIATTS